MDRGGGASQVVDLVDFKEKWLNDVVSYELKSGVTKMVHHVLFPSSEEIINDNHAIPSLDQTVHQVGPDETRPTRNNDPFPFSLQPQRNLPAGIPGLNPEPALVVDRPVAPVVRRLELNREWVQGRVVAVPLGSLGGREKSETQDGDSNADEDEYQPLFTEHVSNRTGHDEPWFKWLGRVGIGHRLGLVTPENQLRTHRNPCLLSELGFYETDSVDFFFFFSFRGQFGFDSKKKSIKVMYI